MLLTIVKQAQIFRKSTKNPRHNLAGCSLFAWVFERGTSGNLLLLPRLQVDREDTLPDTATLDDTSARRLQGRIDQFCSGLGFVHGVLR
jgi:hypothetical protein